MKYKLTYGNVKCFFVGTYPNTSKCCFCIIWLMSKEHFIRLAGSQRKLADLLGISQAAVAQWKTVPKARIWQLQLLRPEWFK